MITRELLFPPGATRQDWVLDGLLTTAVFTATVLPYWLLGAYNGVRPALWLASLSLMVVPLVLRRHSPLLMLAGCTVAGGVQLLVSSIFTAPLIVLPLVAYSVARWIPGPPARAVAVVGLIGSVLGPLRWTLTPGMVFNLRTVIALILQASVCLGLIVTPYAIGRRVRESTQAHQDRIAAADERYQMLLAERDQQARLAESRARAQIARELHDIVAHSLSVMIVQAEGGRAMAPKRPEASLEALDTIAETGREALSEMRRIVGVLRREPDDTPVEYAPVPTLEDIPELVQRATDRAHLRIIGVPPRVSPALELTGYRVVQEALTNFLKHAGPDATCSVTITYRERDILVEVVDTGPGRVTSSGPPGHGLRGMTERITSMGGSLEAHPRPYGGFAVRATLPLTN